MTPAAVVNLAFLVAVGWLALLGAIVVGLVLRARSALDRVLALDLFAIIVAALLAAHAAARDAPHYLEAAIVVALLSFVETIAASRYLAEGRLF